MRLFSGVVLCKWDLRDSPCFSYFCILRVARNVFFSLLPFGLFFFREQNNCFRIFQTDGRPAQRRNRAQVALWKKKKKKYASDERINMYHRVYYPCLALCPLPFARCSFALIHNLSPEEICARSRRIKRTRNRYRNRYRYRHERCKIVLETLPPPSPLFFAQFQFFRFVCPRYSHPLFSKRKARIHCHSQFGILIRERSSLFILNVISIWIFMSNGWPTNFHFLIGSIDNVTFNVAIIAWR